MRIRLSCKCGCEGEWDGDYSTYVMEQSEKWAAQHRECLVKMGGSSADLKSAPVKYVDLPWR